VRSTAKFAAVWVILGAVAYLGFDSVISPKVARPVATDGHGVVIIPRSHDQHFYVEGSINGHPVTFLVDTGATLVSVNQELARKIGLGPGTVWTFDTAVGRSTGRIIKDVTVQVGGIRVDGIRVGVTPGAGVALLGENFLNKLDVRQNGDRMTFGIH
jgi:aspartyl protease family protein